MPHYREKQNLKSSPKCEESVKALLFLFARHGRALTGVSPEHAQIVGSV